MCRSIHRTSSKYMSIQFLLIALILSVHRFLLIQKVSNTTAPSKQKAATTATTLSCRLGRGSQNMKVLPFQLEAAEGRAFADHGLAGGCAFFRDFLPWIT